MGGMSGIENALPPARQFETNAEALREPLTDELHEIILKYDDVINPNVEFEKSTQLHWYWTLSGLLALALKSETEDVTTTQGAVYRGMFFGLQLAENVQTKPVEHFSLSYLLEIEDVEALGEVIANDVNEYLGERPHLSALISEYMPEICDEEYMLSDHHAEIGAGFALMLMERQQAEAYIIEQAQNFGLDKLS